MNFNELDYLKSDGFVGYKSVGELMTDHSRIPSVGGVYVFLRPSDDAPEFLEEGTGGFFKRSAPKDPNVSLQELSANWVDGTSIVYIGKATSLKTRLSAYLRFGEGKFATHWGGRYIWQLKDSRDLIVCWKVTGENPRDVEERIIADFKARHNGQRPFANLQD